MKKIFKIFLLVFFSSTFQAFGEDFNITQDYSIKIFDNTENIIKENNKTHEADIGVTVDVNFFLEKAQKNNFKEIIIATKVETTKWGGDIRAWLYSYFFTGVDSIFKPNQNQNLYFKKGTNSIVVQDFNINKYLNNNKDDFQEVSLGLKKFLKKNSINIPDSALRSDHLYLKGNGSFFWITYIYNYHLTNKSLISNLSKFYPNAINENNEHKKFMDNWISLSIKRHDIFQNSLKVSSKSKIDFNYNDINLDNDLNYFEEVFYGNKEIKKNKATLGSKLDNNSLSKENTIITTKMDLENQIKKLKEINELYENGIINDDEMQVLKDKILKN